MKKILLIVSFCSILFLSGCTLQDVKDKWVSATNRIMQKDQAHEQWFTVDKQLIYDNFATGAKYIKLTNLGLTSIPDICALLDPIDRAEVRHLNLSNNKIRIVDADLSCLTHLQTLNLSYNEISTVVRLGSLPTLRDLQLHKNQLTTVDDLPDLPGLQKLNLGYNKLKEVIWIDKYINLIKLELQHNMIEKIIWAEKLQKLEELKLEFNKLTDLPFLDTLKQLKSLTTEGNALKETVTKQIQALQEKFLPLLSGAIGASGR